MGAKRTIPDLVTLARRSGGDELQAALRGASDAKLEKLADELEEKELFAAAEVVQRELVDRNPKDGQRWLALGRNVYYLQRHAERADEVFAQALRRVPRDAELLGMRALNLNWGCHRAAEALPFYERALKANPVHAVNRLNMASCLADLGEVNEVLQHARRAAYDVGNDEEHEDYRDAVQLNAAVFIYLLTPKAEERHANLRKIARFVAAGAHADEFESIVALARKRKHPEAAHLDALVAVLGRTAKVSTLRAWPAWQAAARPFAWPADVEPPSLLKTLLRFADADEDLAFSATFELDRDEDGIAWCGSAELARDLAVFGRDADGAPYGFWLGTTRDLRRAPVVYLDSEGSDSSAVVAGSLREFMALLGLCLDELGSYASWDGPWAAGAVAERAKEPLSAREKTFRRWLKDEHGIRVPTAAEAERIVKKARAAHPKFADWLARCEATK